MSRLGISFRIDVTKIDKSKLFKGAQESQQKPKPTEIPFEDMADDIPF